MIGKLTGQIDSLNSDHLILDVGGVGYLVFCSRKVLYNFQTKQKVSLFIETHIREDHIHLYGFLEQSEREYFTLLQQVSGIGPKMALSILSSLSPNDIAMAVARNDKLIFKNVSGVGTKIAERIIIELKSKTVLVQGGISDIIIKRNDVDSNFDVYADAVSALINLGVNRVDAQGRVASVVSSNPEIKIDEVIKLALKAGPSI